MRELTIKEDMFYFSNDLSEYITSNEGKRVVRAYKKYLEVSEKLRYRDGVDAKEYTTIENKLKEALGNYWYARNYLNKFTYKSEKVKQEAIKTDRMIADNYRDLN